VVGGAGGAVVVVVVVGGTVVGSSSTHTRSSFTLTWGLGLAEDGSLQAEADPASSRATAVGTTA